MSSFRPRRGYRGDGRLRQFLEAGRALEGDLHHHRAHRHRRADAAPGERRHLVPCKMAFSGSAPLPVELFRRFEKATGVNIVEGYGLTEATCLVSCNPPDGEKKIGSVGIPFPHTDVRILKQTPNPTGDHRMQRRRGRRDLCRQSRRLSRPHLYRHATRTRAVPLRPVSAHRRSRPDRCRRIPLDHRAREGSDHPGRPQHRPRRDRGGAAGMRPSPLPAPSASPTRFRANCPAPSCGTGRGRGARSTSERSRAAPLAARQRPIHERAAHPKHLAVLDELPKTAVGKVFKPDLRKRAIKRVYERPRAHGAALSALIDRLGFVQVDSVNTLARAHDLILWSRRPTYRPSSLRWLNDRARTTFEHWTHDAAIVPMAFYPHWRLRFARDRERLHRRWKDWHGDRFHGELDRILAHVDRNGPVSSGEFAGESQRNQQDGGIGIRRKRRSNTCGGPAISPSRGAKAFGSSMICRNA
jgi:hypothetical protein